MKRILVFMLMITIAGTTYGQQFDTVAIKILDRMSDIIGDLSSCRYTLNISKDLYDFDLGQTTQYNSHEVYMLGPDKMLINSNGDNGHKEYWYNGTLICYYNFDEHNYAELYASDNILETIDTMSKRYGIDFPAADFFYPTFTDDLMNIAEKISYAGTSQQKGKECFHIVANCKDKNVQFWIRNDATMLPEKMVINYKSAIELTRYEVIFSEWQLNPVLPESMFDFMRPPGAALLTLVPKN